MSDKRVLISIKPKWCGKIFSGFKNLEFRKAVPKIDLPFKCYVYCTAKEERLIEIIRDGDDVYGTEYHGKDIFIKGDKETPVAMFDRCKTVIGEMTVDRVEEITVRFDESDEYDRPVAYYGSERFLDLPKGYIFSGGITLPEYMKYKGKGKVYGWRISDYKLYDKPKKIDTFRLYGTDNPVKYPPQSYVFVNDLSTLYPSGSEEE